MILGAVFYGYIVTQIPGGLFAEKFGAKWLFGSGIFVTSLLTILTSVVASYGTIFFMIVRVLEGFFEVSTIEIVSIHKIYLFVRNANFFFIVHNCWRKITHGISKDLTD